MKKILLIGLCLLLLAGACFGISCIPRQVTRSWEGVQYNESTGQIQCRVQVEIRGYLSAPWFSEPVFRGDIAFLQGEGAPGEAYFGKIGEAWGDDMIDLLF